MLTETQVLEQWIEYCLPVIKEQYEQDGIADKPARRQSWANFIDSLERGGQITEELAFNIDANVEDL